MLKIDALKKKRRDLRSSVCDTTARVFCVSSFLRVFARKTTRFKRHHVTRERTNERTNERNQIPPKETLLRRTSFNLSTASNAARPLVVDPEKPEPPLEEDEDEGRPDDALEEEGLPNSLLNMMNICERKNWWFFFEGKEVPFHTKEEVEKTRETRKDDASRSVSIRSIRGVIKRACAGGNDAGFFLLRLRRFRSAFFFSFFFFSFIRLRRVNRTRSISYSRSRFRFPRLVLLFRFALSFRCCSFSPALP